MKKITRCLMMVLMALLYAVTYELFVFPNKFAPAGLNGIATIAVSYTHLRAHET